MPLTDEDRQAISAAVPADVPNLPAWLAARITPERRQAAIAARQQAIDDDTATLLDYVARSYVLDTKPLTSGSKTSPRTLADDIRIVTDYNRELRREREARAADSRRERVTDKAIAARVAARHGIAGRTLQRIRTNTSAKIK